MDLHFINKWHAAFPFSCIQRKGHPTVDPKSEWNQGVHDPGAFKLDHLQSMKPIFAKYISTLLTLTCSSSLFLHPGKRAPYIGPQKWMTPRGVWPWGIQIRPFAVHEAYFWKLIFHFINSHMQDFPFPACREKGTPQWTPKVNDTKGCMTLGHSNWTICSPRKPIFPNWFSLY